MNIRCLARPALVTFAVLYCAHWLGQSVGADPLVKSPFFQPVTPPRPFQVMVHRGVAQAAPENTRPAIEMAIEDGLEWVEVDLRRTADGQHVLFHDEQLDSKTDGKGPLVEHTLAELQQLDAGTWFASRFAGTRLLSLADALELAKGRVNLYLDCKSVDPVQLVREIHEADMQQQVVVYADVDTLRRVRNASAGRVHLMCKWHSGDNIDIDALQSEVAPSIVEIDADVVTPDICRQFHQRGMQVQARVLDESDCPETWAAMLDASVDYLQTDRPGEILALHLRRLYGDRARPVKMTCHRGASRYAPENTLPAIELAIRLGADLVEIDVRTTKDGQQYLLHDATLDRTTNGKGPIRESNATMVESLDAGRWFGRPFIDSRVPSLVEGLAATDGKIGIYFDAKDIEPEALVTSLRERGLIARTIVFQSPGYLAKVQQLEPKLATLAPLFSPGSLEPLAKKLKPTAFDVGWHDLSAELIERCHKLEIQVYSDAPDDAAVEDYLRAIDWKIDQIQTDQPLRLIRAMELRANRND